MEQETQERIKAIVEEAYNKRGKNRTEIMNKARVIISEMGIVTRHELKQALSFLNKETQKDYIRELVKDLKAQRIRKVEYAFYEKPLFSFQKYQAQASKVIVFDSQEIEGEMYGTAWTEYEPHLTLKESVTGSHLSTDRKKLISYQWIYIKE